LGRDWRWGHAIRVRLAVWWPALGGSVGSKCRKTGEALLCQNPPTLLNSFATAGKPGPASHPFQILAFPWKNNSVAICFVHHAIAGLRARGIAPEPVLQAAGIVPALLAVPQARVSAASYSALWMEVAAALDDEFFGPGLAPP